MQRRIENDCGHAIVSHRNRLIHSSCLYDSISEPGKLLGNQGPCAAVRICHQDRTVRSWIDLSIFGLNRGWLIRQEHPERRSSHRIALGPYSPAVLQDDGTTNGQAESAAALLSRIRGIHLLKS